MILENLIGVTFSVKYFSKQTDEHKLQYFSLKAILKTILRVENIEQIYHKHKIREIPNCDVTKTLEQDSQEIFKYLFIKKYF